MTYPLGIDPNKIEFHSYPNVEPNWWPDARFDQGFRSVCEYPSDGFVNVKAYCAACTRSFGAFENISLPDVDTGYVERPSKDDLNRASRRYLINKGFKLHANGRVICPHCQGMQEPGISLEDGLPIVSTNWYTTTMHELGKE